MSKFSSWKTVLFLCVLCAATAITSPAQSGCSVAAPCFTTLVSFNGTDGANPYSSLVQGRDGNLYGTTPGGGAHSSGTVFQITQAGTPTPVYDFCSEPNCIDGSSPIAGLVLATDGNFYGVTESGGAHGFGTVFKLSPKPSGGCPSGSNTGTGWCESPLYSFPAQNCDAHHYDSCAGLVQGTDGKLYGTTIRGGTNNAGTVFKITSEGVLTTLHNFCSQTNCPDGANPTAALVQATNGNFYGATRNGGSSSPVCGPEGGCGTFFEITTGGILTTLHKFDDGDGLGPQAALIQAANGNFYGTANGGGTNFDGSVFEVTAGGKLTTLYSFCSKPGCTDGSFPTAGLAQATDTNFYGATPFNGANSTCGGNNGCGTLFQITQAGTLTTLTTLYNFCPQTNCPDGANPFGGLVQATNGSFYGTTFDYGASNAGTVFSLSVGLGPFVEAVTYSGKVGNTIEFLRQNFTSSSTVSFNGTKSPTVTVPPQYPGTYLTATVPTGATTGFVTVTTSGGTLKSNKKFRLIPQITGFSPPSGPAGTVVTITGVSLKQAMKVTFDGVKAAVVTVDSDTQVKATVPTGAKTGKITVTTPGGTATSIANFTVT